MALKVNYKDDMFTGDRRYQLVNNADGTVTLKDVTTYTQTGDAFGGADINATNTEINKIIDGAIKVAKAVDADTLGGKPATGFAVFTSGNKDVNSMVSEPTGYYQGKLTGLPSYTGDGQGTLEFINYSGNGVNGSCQQIFYSAYGGKPIIRTFAGGKVSMDWRNLSDGGDAHTVDGKHASDFATSAQGVKADNAMPKSGGTFDGNTVAPNNTDYGTIRMRNIAGGTTAPSSLANGALFVVYE